jgi:hypothetical protein
MRLAILLASLLLLSACTEADSNAARVFERAFALEAPPSGVVALNGYRLERRRFFVVSDAMWRLHLGGPGAKDFVQQRWPDLRAGTRRAFVQGSQTPWFAPGRHVRYIILVSAQDPAVTVMQTVDSDEVFIAYDPT